MSHRLVVPTLMLLATAATVDAATIRNRQIHDIDLRSLQENPSAYQGLSVRFRATFVQTSNLYAPFHTPFTPERFMNLVVWDDQAPLWRPEVRADPLTTLYYEKERLGTTLISGLDKYTLVDVTGEVVAAYRGQPWIDISEIEAVGEHGIYNGPALKLLEEADKLHEEGEYALADQNYQAALQHDLPDGGRIALQYLRAKNAFDADDEAAAIAFLEDGLSSYASWSGESLPYSRGELHFLMARAEQGLAEEAGEGTEESKPHYEKAITHGLEAIAEHPENGDAHAVLGIALAGVERYDDARLRCQRAVRMLPDNAEVRWYLGRIYDLQGSYDEAINTLKRAIDLAPKDYRIHKSIAASYFNRGTKSTPRNHDDVVLALREYDIAIKLEPEDADLFYFSGMVLKYGTEQGIEVRIGTKTVAASMDLAVQRWIACLAVDDNYVQAHLELAQYYRSVEQHDDALTHYQRAIELRPQDYDLQHMLGEYYWAQERRAEAYQTYAGIQDAIKDDQKAIYALQRLSLELGEDAQGVPWGAMLLKLDPNNMDCRTNQAELLQRSGAAREAVTMADTVLGKDPDQARLLRARVAKALALWDQDRPEEVIETVGQTPLVELGPKLRFAFAWSLTGQETEDREPLVAAAQAAVADDPARLEAQELLAWAQYLSGDAAAAEKTLQPLADNKIPADRFAYRMGMILFAQGPTRYEAAKPLLEQARDLRSRETLLRDASREAGRAQSEIRTWERDEAKRMDREKREAERKARDEARAKAKADAAAKKQAEADARAKADAEREAKKQAEAEAKAKARAEREAKEKAEAEARRKAAEAKKRQ